MRNDIKHLMREGENPRCLMSLQAEHITKEQEDREERTRAGQEFDLLDHIDFEDNPLKNRVVEMQNFAKENNVALQAWADMPVTRQIMQFASAQNSFSILKSHANLSQVIC